MIPEGPEDRRGRALLVNLAAVLISGALAWLIISVSLKYAMTP